MPKSPSYTLEFLCKQAVGISSVESLRNHVKSALEHEGRLTSLHKNVCRAIEDICGFVDEKINGILRGLPRNLLLKITPVDAVTPTPYVYCFLKAYEEAVGKERVKELNGSTQEVITIMARAHATARRALGILSQMKEIPELSAALQRQYSWDEIDRYQS